MTAGVSPSRRSTAAVWWPTVATAWGVSRLVSAVGLVVGGIQAANGWSLGGFAAWDGHWYRLIAAGGYGPAPIDGLESPWPFFPLLPAIIRVFDAFGLPGAALMVLVNQLLLGVALIGVWRVAERRFGVTVAKGAVWAVAAFPMTGVFSMLYPSSIFLAATVWAFDLADRQRWVWCGIAALGATAVRPNGALTAAVLTLAVLLRGDPARRWHRAVAVAAPTAAMVAGWMVVCAVRTGNPLVFITAKGAWEEHDIVDLAFHLLDEFDLSTLAVHSSLGLLFAVPLALTWRRLPPSWRALAAFAVGLPLVAGMAGLGRYVNECFPLAVAASVGFQSLHAWARRSVALGSMIAVGVASASMASYGLLP